MMSVLLDFVSYDQITNSKYQGEQS